MNKLKATLIQTQLHWESQNENLVLFSSLLDTINEETHLIVLPEMFTTGFTMHAQPLAETMSGNTLQWLKKESARLNAVITATLIVKENGKYYNRLVWVEGDKKLYYYDKKHTFTLAGEQKVYTSGTKKLIINYRGWKFCPLICYDLRFPVWARNTQNYDVLIYTANWPNKRIQAWDALLKARAIENMCYTIGVNRIGEDGNGHQYIGHSNVYDVLGTPLLPEKLTKTFVKTITLDKTHITNNRNALGFLNDRDAFTLD